MQVDDKNFSFSETEKKIGVGNRKGKKEDGLRLKAGGGRKNKNL